MTLFIILLSAITAIAITALISAIIDVGSLFVVFGDVIAFSLIIWLIIKIFRRKKK